ncbi:hypothetical protein BVX98_07870, partial [bacterium F11]
MNEPGLKNLIKKKLKRYEEEFVSGILSITIFFGLSIMIPSYLVADYEMGNQIYHENDTEVIMTSGNLWLSYRFTALETVTFNQVRVKMSGKTSSINFYIYSDNAGNPGVALSTGSYTFPGGAGDIDAWLTISNFNASPTLTVDNVYHLVIYNNGASNKTTIRYVSPETNSATRIDSDNRTNQSDGQLALMNSSDGASWGTVTDAIPAFVIESNDATPKLFGSPYNEATQQDGEGAITLTTWSGEIFQWPSARTISKVGAYLEKVGTPTETNIIWQIHTVNGAGADVAFVSSGTLATVASIGTTAGWYEAAMSTVASLSASTDYRFRLEASGGSHTAGSYIWSGRALATGNNSTTSDPPSTMQSLTWEDTTHKFSFTTNSGTNWTARVGGDMPFKFYVDNTVPTVGLTTPASGDAGYISSLPTISGVSADNVAIHTTEGLQLWIRNTTDGKNWIGGDPASAGNWTTEADSARWIDHAGGTTWESTFSWTNNRAYRIVARANDTSGNKSTIFSTSTFVYDTEAPDSITTIPGHGNYYNSATISGTATDNVQGEIGLVEYAIERVEDGQYYSDADGNFTCGGCGSLFWNTAPTLEENPDNPGNLFTRQWTDLLNNTGAYEDGKDYRITTRAYDKVTPTANIEVIRSTNTFTWDITKPTSTITGAHTVKGDITNFGSVIPGPPSARLAEGATFYGEYGDATSGVVASNMRVFILNMTDNKFWTGERTGVEDTDWATCVGNEAICADPGGSGTPDNYLIPVDNLYQTSWTVLGPKFTSSQDGDNFWIVSRARDSANSLQNDFTAGASSSSFRVDMGAPDVRLTVPGTAGEYRGNLDTIEGNGSDGAGLSEIHIEISSPATTPSLVWDGDSWEAYTTAFATYVTIAGVTPWSYNSSGISFSDGVNYRVKVRGLDQLNNEGNTAPSADSNKDFIYDATDPTSSIDTIINGGVYSTISLSTGTATDTNPGLVASGDIYIKEGGGSSGSGIYWDGYNFVGNSSAIWLPWDNYASNDWDYTMNYSTNLSNGNYWYRTRARDSGGNEEGNGDGGTAIQITIDKTLPESGVQSLASYVNSLTTLTGTASDNGAIESVFIRLYAIPAANQTYCWGPAVSCPGGTVGFKAGNLDEFPADPSSSLYWTQASYSAVPGTWSVTVPTLTNGYTYRVVSRARDTAKNGGESGNLTNWEVDVSTTEFTYDLYIAAGGDETNERPGTIVTFPSNNSHHDSTFTYITGTATDNTLFDRVDVLLRKFSGGVTYYWIGGAWDNTFDEDVQVWPVAIPDPPNTDMQDEATELWRSTTATVANWAADTLYDFRARGVDKASNIEVSLSTISFVYDLADPDTLITFPVASGFISQAGNISGTADDTGAGFIDRVMVRLQRDSDDKFLDISGGLPGSWVTDVTSDTWNTVYPTGGNPWDWTLSTAAWNSGITYNANAYAIDRASHTDLSYSTVTFSADFQAPSSVVTLPAHTDTKSSLPTISGTTADVGPSGISAVWVAYYRTSSGRWWNNSNGQFDSNVQNTPPGSVGTGNYWVEATTVAGSPMEWYTTDNSTPTFGAETYEILSVAIDIASNQEDVDTAAAANSSRISFTFTAPSPESKLTRPSVANTHFRSNLATISGTVNAQATGIEVRIKDITNSSNHLAWNGAAWESTTTFNNFITANKVGLDWDYIVPQSSWTSLNKYQVESKALGSPDETSPFSTQVFYIDDGDPTGTVTMPDVQYKNSLPTFSGTADDDSDGMPGGNKTVYFRLLNTSNEYFVGISSSWVADPGVNCITTVDNTCLPAGNEGGDNYSYSHSSFTEGGAFSAGSSYEVYIVVKDAAGNSHAPLGTSFTWDATKPTSGITRPTASQPINSLPNVSGTANDSGFVVNVTSFSLRSLKEDRCYNPAFSFFTETCPYWVGTSTDASYNWIRTDTEINSLLNTYNTWYVLLSRAIDVAGNQQDTFTGGISSRTFMSDTQVPIISIGFPVHNNQYKGSEVSGGGTERLQGSVSDPNAPYNSGIRSVELRLSYLSGPDTYYWQNPVFSSGAAVSNNGWFPAHNLNWEYFTAVDWRPVDSEYTFEVRAEDLTFGSDGSASGNISDADALGTEVINFIIDDTPPDVGISSPNAAAIKNLTQITGTANATLSGLDSVTIKISTGSSPEYYWTGSSWTTNITWLSTTKDSETAWHYTVPGGMLADDTQYTAVARSLDNANQYSPAYSTRTFTYDTTAPTITLDYPLSESYSQVKVSTPIQGTTSNTQ